MRVGVIGAGVMVSDIAPLFSNAGNEVVLVDISEEALKKAMSKNFDEAKPKLEEAGILQKEDPIRDISYTTSYKFLEGCSFIVEIISEDLDEKRKLMERVEEIVSKDCVIVSNSSSYTISEISEGMERPERTASMHFSNPPILRELAEISGGERTGDETLETTLQVAKDIGKTSVVPDRECRGLVLNRILMMITVSTSYLFADGASPMEIDASFRELGSERGIFEIDDMVGLDLMPNIHESFYEAYGERFQPHEDFAKNLSEMIDENKLGKKTGEGFYKWEGGEPVIPEASSGIDLTGILASMVNEGYRIIEDGVADKGRINKIYKLASSSSIGIFTFLDVFSPEEFKEKLEELYDKWETEAFKPTEGFLEDIKD